MTRTGQYNSMENIYIV